MLCIFFILYSKRLEFRCILIGIYVNMFGLLSGSNLGRVYAFLIGKGMVNGFWEFVKFYVVIYSNIVIIMNVLIKSWLLI